MLAPAVKDASCGQPAPERPGVYYIAAPEAFPRLKGSTDLLYIGSTKNLRKRLADHRCSIKRCALPWPGKALRMGWSETKTAAEAKNREAILQSRYWNEHLELPPLNRAHAISAIEYIYRRPKATRERLLRAAAGDAGT